ncbi:MAG: tetratricopeptide repeat protein [Rhodoferax sp.]
MDYYGCMRLKPFFWPLLLALSSTPLALAAPTSKPALAAVPQASAMDGALLYQVLLAELQARDGQAGDGFALMLEAAQRQGDGALYRRAVQIALQARAGESALQGARAWAQAQPAAAEAHRYVVQILLALNRPADVVEPLRKWLANTPAEQQRDWLWGLPALFERVGDHSAAASAVQKALSPTLADGKPLADTAWAVVGRLWQSASDTPRAVDAARKASSQSARSEHAALLALNLLPVAAADVEPLVQRHLPYARGLVHMSYIKVLIGAGRDADAQAQIQALQARHPDYADAWLIDGALALQGKQPDRAEQQLKRYLALTDAAAADPQRASEVASGRSQAYLALSQVAQSRKDYAGADAWLQRIQAPEDQLRAQIRRAQLLAAQNQLDAAVALIQSQPELRDGDDALKRAAEVQLLRERKLWSRLQARLDTLLAQHPEDHELAYELAMTHEKLGDLKAMETVLRSLIASRPHDAQAYNALGYALADRGLRLDEARQLIVRALEITPGDPFITDSLAWVEYRMGNLPRALELLQTAYKARPDAEIAAHLGEVLWRSQQPDAARAIWREGLSLNPDNETLQETLQRLQVTL